MSTKFQQRVWDAISMIPEGRVSTYAEIAHHLGTKAYRAVGTAVGRNPHAPKVPCHRVVPSDGRIGRYSGTGGVETKISLLHLEGVEVSHGMVVDFETRLWSFDRQQSTRSGGS